MHTYIIMSLQGVCLSSRGFLSVVLSGGYCLKDFVRVVFVFPPLSDYIHYNRKPNITFNFRFQMYEFFKKCDVKCSWTRIPLSQTVTPSRGSPLPLERDVLYGRPSCYIIAFHNMPYKPSHIIPSNTLPYKYNNLPCHIKRCYKV